MTYEADVDLPTGSVVTIPLQKETAIGIVVGTASKPNFKTKKILNVVVKSAVSPQSMKLMTWLGMYYPSPSGLIHGLLAPSYLQKIDPVITSQKLDKVQNKPVSLNKEQQKVVESIGRTPGHSVLLHGDTASGKTRVYIELARQSLLKGKSAIILTPEIGLTTQLVNSFVAVFGNRVIVMHSGLTPKSRRTAWLQTAQSNEPIIVIGPRSSLFAAIKSIGLIVVDEMHDSAYKQEQAPYFLTSRVAAKLAQLHQAKAIFGSATPPVHDYYIFLKNHLPIFRMTGTASGEPASIKVDIVDLKNHSDFTRSKWLSNTLVDHLTRSLKSREQSLVFINRRGTARVILCQNCGWQATCPRCDLPLTYHGDSHNVICHTCGFKDGAPSNCPTCGSSEIIFKTAGTKSIVNELERLFPKAIVRRFDSDVKKANDLKANFSDIVDGKVDILVGTQMLGKGLDLPRLSVVGVVQADSALNFPDYTAEERTYQMLNQVIGRVGRGHVAGSVILQTHNPGSELIRQAVRSDYASFYAQQIAQRQEFKFPPYCYLLKLTCQRKNESSAETAANDLGKKIASLTKEIEVIGPSPSFIGKINNVYRWQLIVKSVKRPTLTKIIGILPSGWTYDIDPTHLL